ncbi:MAG: ORF6N domain-containing protein [Pseudomonadota bacterium]
MGCVTHRGLAIHVARQRLRDQKIMIDAGPAELYGVPTKRLNEQVKRNQDRFPADRIRMPEQTPSPLFARFY